MKKHLVSSLMICTLALALSCQDEEAALPSSPEKALPGPFIAKAIVEISETSITTCIRSLQSFGTRYYRGSNRDSVASWIRSQFLALGFTDVSFHTCQVNGSTQNSVVATLAGTLLPSQEIIVCGHYDSYCFDYNAHVLDSLHAPGADDNASGTAGVIELARVLKAQDYHPRHTIRFICFAAEEVGARGSLVYASEASTQKRDIRLVVNFDMIAYHGDQPTTYSVDTRDTVDSKLVADIAKLYMLDPPVLRLGMNGADDGAFLQFRYSHALHTLCYSDLIHPYAYLHTPNDLLTNLDVSYEKTILKSAVATILTWDQTP
jgi:leucyl aminopeptidase